MRIALVVCSTALLVAIRELIAAKERSDAQRFALRQALQFISEELDLRRNTDLTDYIGDAEAALIAVRLGLEA